MLHLSRFCLHVPQIKSTFNRLHIMPVCHTKIHTNIKYNFQSTYLLHVIGWLLKLRARMGVTWMNCFSVKILTNSLLPSVYVLDNFHCPYLFLRHKLTSDHGKEIENYLMSQYNDMKPQVPSSN